MHTKLWERFGDARLSILDLPANRRFILKQDPDYYRAYYAANRERLLKKMKAYHVINRAKRQAYGRSYYAENRQQIKVKSQRYRIANQDKTRARKRDWSARNKVRCAANARNAKLRRKFGITQIEYENILRAQDGVCALCKKPCVTGVALAVDHCHKTGRVRGLLCLKCNVGVGMYEKFDSLKVRQYIGICFL